MLVRWLTFCICCTVLLYSLTAKLVDNTAMFFVEVFQAVLKHFFFPIFHSTLSAMKSLNTPTSSVFFFKQNLRSEKGLNLFKSNGSLDMSRVDQRLLNFVETCEVVSGRATLGLGLSEEDCEDRQTSQERALLPVT